MLAFSQSRTLLYAFGTGEYLSLSVRMRDVRTLDLTILHSAYCSLTIEIECISPTVSRIFCFLTYC